MTNQSLKSAGLRPTLPRRLILEVLETSSDRHQGAEDIYQALRDAGHEVGLATVYRVLTQFEQSGIVLRHRFAGEDKAYWELNDEVHHDHIVCVKCGRVLEFIDDSIEQRQVQVAQSFGFTLEGHSLHLYGVCNGMNESGQCSISDETHPGIKQLEPDE